VKPSTPRSRHRDGINPFYTMTTFFKNISWIPKEVSAVLVFWNSTFLFFKILIANQDMRVFQYFYVSM
jgi:hypothetical protein